MQTILITGGAGFIGSHLAEEYLRRGYRVVIADYSEENKAKNLQTALDHENARYYSANIRDKAAAAEIFARHKPDIVSHHAAQKSIPKSMDDPAHDADVNITGLLNVLDLAGRHGTRNFIYISSGGALAGDIAEGGKSRESDYPQLASPYAISKFAGEQYVRVYAQKYGFAFSALRYANVYGPRQAADGECGVVPIFVNNILAGAPSALMAYSDLPRGCTRDYVFILDVVRANMLVTEKPLNDVVNIGSGVETAVLDIYEGLAREFASEVPIVAQGPRAGDLRRAVLDCSKMEDFTGWRAQVSLAEGLRAVREWTLGEAR
ncbi:MAG: SDR family NAD(P)-dependent oxidoreductase [Oscillospiraceae bacterium]|jgi:UDP-glucose 4-epimerase|nr:SDR family NAD(P)-dependent oxidoreductase [Oscillospiraceae bacterium]